MATNTRPHAVIFGCEGPVLSEAEKRSFAEVDPLGFILFARNCVDPAQVRTLVDDLRSSVGRDDAPILIDQEGGRVQRLGPPHWRQRPPQGLFAKMAETDIEVACEAAKTNAQLIALELISLGIDVDCLPLLDVPVPGAHDIIGDRAYGYDPSTVAKLGAAVCDGLISGGVLPVIKHIPGHGRALVDSHKDLPRVDADAETLRATDFAPFQALSAAPWAMTAHVVYTAFDADAPATLSQRVIQDVIRGEIGYQGFLVSDDMNMKALQGDPGKIAADIVAAGCDAILHCNGRLEEMQAMAADLPMMTDAAWSRLVAGRDTVSAPLEVDVAALQAHFDVLTSDYTA